MEEIRVGEEIRNNEVVGLIYEVDGIYYMRVGLGKKPRHGGNEVKAFKGGNEVEPEVAKMVENLNNGSSAYQKHRKELKKENKGQLKKVREPLTSERERKKMKRMASDVHVFDFFS